MTHLAPAVVLQMTPDQTEVILEEYVAMNRVDSGDETVEPQALGVQPRVQAASATASGEPSLAQRIQAELAERLAQGRGS